jgi:TolA-binding protein
MKSFSRIGLSLCLLVSLVNFTACSFLSNDDRGRTLADLPKPKKPDNKRQIEVQSISTIEQSYQRALSAAEEPVLRQQIKARIADLEMIRSEKEQLNAGDAGRHYDKPIALYRELLTQQTQNNAATKGVAVDQLRYKLAKALSMDGRSEEAAAVLDELASENSNSPFIAETQFRRAEKAFADGDYAAAERNYESVVKGDNPALQQNALYMKGWSQFKRSQYDLALVSFTQVLDQLLGSAQKPEEIDKVITDMGPSKANLVKDTLRVMAIGLSYLDGAKSISQLESDTGGPRAYQFMLYQQLGNLYLEQKRYTDSAATYQHFVVENPDSDFAPSFSIKIIDVYQQGDFPDLVLPAKKDFVQRYGITSQHWAKRQGAIGDSALAYLHQSLVELAQFDHAEAQSLQAANKINEATSAFTRAARWYREFVQTFPKDAQVAEMHFLLAECLNQSGDLAAALTAYEIVAYDYKDKMRGAESGYATVLLPQQLISNSRNISQDQLAEWSDRKIENALRFAEFYPADPRAINVLADAGSELLQQNRFPEAKIVAERVLSWQPPAEGKLQFTSWLILGHSRFELKEYPAAEQAYIQVQRMLPSYGQMPGAPTTQQVSERIAASIYKQAELGLEQGNKDEAIAQLLRVAETSPGTEIAVKAQYDAGVYLMEQEKWAQAENVYLSFRQKYGQNALAASIPAKMVLIYQNQSKWQLAADELGIMERTSTDPNVKRQSLFMGAELYEKSGKLDLAVERYSRFAKEYPKPVTENIEAQHKLTELLAKSGDRGQRLYWLQNIVNTHQRAGSEKTDRSTWLAASAQSELSQPSVDEYKSIQLTAPLKNSLPRKRAALEKALKSQEQVLSYGVSEFTTKANFTIGEIYSQLSKDLMNSQRPTGLDELAMEEYQSLLEEQAYPFEEKAIEIHEANIKRSWEGTYDDWVKQSFNVLAKLLPARYNKTETRVEVSDEIY